MNEYIVKINDSKKSVTILSDEHLKVDENKFKYHLSELNCSSYLLKLNNKIYQISCMRNSNQKLLLTFGGRSYEVVVRTALQEKALKLIEESKTSLHHKTEVRAPMPGMILKIKKSAGDEITQGESVVILEAMKMENDLKAPASGTIKTIGVKEGSAVEKGMILFTIE